MQVIQTNLNYTKRLIPLNLELIEFFVLHHIESISATPEEIHQWHLNNGWIGFGYNEYIRKDGTVYIGRGDNIGAHCLNHNSSTYGIALEGNFSIEKPTWEQIVSLNLRIETLKNKYINIKEVVNHFELCDTLCPVIDLAHEMRITKTETYLRYLVEKDIINSLDFWVINLRSSPEISLKYLKILIGNAIDGPVSPLVLYQLKIITNFNYWKDVFDEKKPCLSINVKYLIYNLVRYLNEIL